MDKSRYNATGSNVVETKVKAVLYSFIELKSKFLGAEIPQGHLRKNYEHVKNKVITEVTRASAKRHPVPRKVLKKFVSGFLNDRLEAFQKFINWLSNLFHVKPFKV